jgi:hypothetical protein
LVPPAEPRFAWEGTHCEGGSPALRSCLSAKAGGIGPWGPGRAVGEGRRVIRMVRPHLDHPRGCGTGTRCALACAGAVLALGAGVAAAHEARFPSSATIHFYDAAAPGSGPSKCEDPTDHDDCFYGRVDSPATKCQANRTVKVFDRNPTPPMRSPSAGTEPELVGQATSDSDGRWIVLVDNPGTHKFFARVTRRVISTPGHTHVCRAAVSDDLEVQSDFG